LSTNLRQSSGQVLDCQIENQQEIFPSLIFPLIENRLSLRLISPLAEIQNLKPVVSNVEPSFDDFFRPL
jgi:hypothetical protein